MYVYEWTKWFIIKDSFIPVTFLRNVVLHNFGKFFLYSSFCKLFIIICTHELLTALLNYLNVRQVQFLFPGVVRKGAPSECVVISLSKNKILLLSKIAFFWPICSSDVLCVCSGKGHILHMFGEGEVQVTVDSLKCSDCVVHNILISHTDVSET